MNEAKSTVKYGSFETYPTRFDANEAWVLIDHVWKKFPIAEINMGAAVLSEAAYVRNFGHHLPALPSAAFQAGE